MPAVHLKCKVVGLSSGGSAVAGVAYQSAEKIYNQETQVSYDYTKKETGLLAKGLDTPENVADWMKDRATLWNNIEKQERSTRKDAQFCRDYVISLPSEFNLEQNKELLQTYCKENYTDKGMIVDWAIHAPNDQGDERNIHAHLKTTMREIRLNKETGEYEFGNKERSWNRNIEKERESWERNVNEKYKELGFDIQINMKSYERQGLEKEAQQHMGKEATAIERKGGEPRISRYPEKQEKPEQSQAVPEEKKNLEKEIKQLEREYTITEKMEGIIDDPTRTRETVKYYQNEDNKEHNEITEQAVRDTIYKQGMQYAELYKKLEEEQKKEATQERAEKIRNVQTKGIEIAKINNKGDRNEMLEYANRESFKNKGFEQELQNRKAQIAQQRADAERERIKAEVEEIAKLQEKERRERERNQERGMSR